MQIDAALRRTLIQTIAEAVIAREQELTDLDQAIGDGDHGLNMKRGFSEVLNKLDSDEYSPQEILEILQTVDQVNPDQTVSTEIGLEEELLIVGDEVLEVDLG